jgi:hypothetical protein
MAWQSNEHRRRYAGEHRDRHAGRLSSTPKNFN